MEESSLPTSLQLIDAHLAARRIDAEVIIVVERSTDCTLEVAKELASRYPYVRVVENDGRFGKAYSVRRGILETCAPRVLFTDADLSTPIDCLDDLRAGMDEEQADCVIANRVQMVPQPWTRRLMGFVFRHLTRVIVGAPFRDTQCGFKLFTRQFALEIFPMVNTGGFGHGFGFDVDIIAFGMARGFKIVDVRTPWYDSHHSTVSPLVDSLDMFLHLFSVRKQARAMKREDSATTTRSDRAPS